MRIPVGAQHRMPAMTRRLMGALASIGLAGGLLLLSDRNDSQPVEDWTAGIDPRDEDTVYATFS
jgi:hypothetical protein